MHTKKRQRGFIITAELVFLVTILFVGSIIGLVMIRDALVLELFDMAKAIEMSEQHAFDGIKTSSPANPPPDQ